MAIRGRRARMSAAAGPKPCGGRRWRTCLLREDDVRNVGGKKSVTAVADGRTLRPDQDERPAVRAAPESQDTASDFLPELR